ncbi:MAG: hypothetical protein WC919_05280 [Candidatus Paceibacterota bacterium]|jgi:hypothetical protein
MDNLDFLNDIPKPPPLPLQKQSSLNKLIVLMAVAVIALICAILVLVVKKTPSYGSSEALVKDEWYAKFKTLTPLLYCRIQKLCPAGTEYSPSDCNPVHLQDLYAALGRPDRTQSIEGWKYWYWKCKDGIIQGRQIPYHAWRTSTEAERKKLAESSGCGLENYKVVQMGDDDNYIRFEFNDY